MTKAERRFKLPANPTFEFVETEDVICRGEPLTDERVDQILADMRRANLVPGGKPLNRDGSHAKAHTLTAEATAVALEELAGL